MGGSSGGGGGGGYRPSGPDSGYMPPSGHGGYSGPSGSGAPPSGSGHAVPPSGGGQALPPSGGGFPESAAGEGSDYDGSGDYEDEDAVSGPSAPSRHLFRNGDSGGGGQRTLSAGPHGTVTAGSGTRRVAAPAGGQTQNVHLGSSGGGGSVVTAGGRGGAPSQAQGIYVAGTGGKTVLVRQDSSSSSSSSAAGKELVLQPGQSVPGSPGYVIPAGFRGRVTSGSGASSQAGDSPRVTSSGGSRAQTQTVRVLGPVPAARPRLRSSDADGDRLPDSFVTVTNSVAGQLPPAAGAGAAPRGRPAGKYTHTYYSKSSTCGYFTFSCNVVYGSNGRTKICKPNPPTNADGTPCCC